MSMLFIPDGVWQAAGSPPVPRIAGICYRRIGPTSGFAPIVETINYAFDDCEDCSGPVGSCQSDAAAAPLRCFGWGFYHPNPCSLAIDPVVGRPECCANPDSSEDCTNEPWCVEGFPSVGGDKGDITH